jgi:uncharacterized phiE125 gp8 family phage protein
MGLVQSTGPGAEPVTLAEAKAQVHIATSAHDTLLTGLIVAARAHCEELTGRQFITATWDWYFNRFPGVRDFAVPWPPLQSVTYIKYIDTGGTLQTLATSVYELDIYSRPGRIALKYGQSWPSIRSDINAVQVRFVAGYGAAGSDVEARLQLLIKRLIAHLFEFPGVVDSTGKVTDTPAGFEQMLAPFTLPEVGGGGLL